MSSNRTPWCIAYKTCGCNHQSCESEFRTRDMVWNPSTTIAQSRRPLPCIHVRLKARPSIDYISSFHTYRTRVWFASQIPCNSRRHTVSHIGVSPRDATLVAIGQSPRYLGTPKRPFRFDVIARCTPRVRISESLVPSSGERVGVCGSRDTLGVRWREAPW